MTFIFPRGYLSGLTLSTAGSSATFGITAGQASDSTNAVIMNSASAFAKTTGAWVLGNGGALDTGTIAANTWYKAFAIYRVDTVIPDVAITTNAISAGPTIGVNIPAAYSLFRYIGSMKTDGSSNWTKFTQYGFNFRWAQATQDVSATNPGTSGVLRTLNIPMGLKVRPDILVTVADLTSSQILSLVTSPDETDRVPSATDFTIDTANTGSGVQATVALSATFSNTVGQVRTRFDRSGANDTLLINTFGWIDDLGTFS